MCAVKACPFNPNDFVARCRAAARASGWRETVFGESDGVPLVAFTSRNVGVKPRIYISAGIHGDEPAPPLAVLQMLETGVFDDRATWFVVPLLNPASFPFSRRESVNGIDLNRDYRQPRTLEIAAHVRWLEKQPRFDLALCLHEDWESKGFYLYELNASDRPGIARELLAAGEAILPVDPDSVIDGRPTAERGIIRPENDPDMRDTWPECIYLRALHTQLCYTLESPSAGPLAGRIALQVAMTRRAIALADRFR